MLLSRPRRRSLFDMIAGDMGFAGLDSRHMGFGGGLLGGRLMTSMMTGMSSAGDESGGVFGSGHGVSQSSMMVFGTGPDGQLQQRYAATSVTRTGGGASETQQTLEDATQGLKRMRISRSMGDRTRVLTREQRADGSEHTDDTARGMHSQAELDHFSQDWARAVQGLPQSRGVHVGVTRTGSGRGRHAPLRVSEISDDVPLTSSRTRLALPAPPARIDAARVSSRRASSSHTASTTSRLSRASSADVTPNHGVAASRGSSSAQPYTSARSGQRPVGPSSARRQE